MEKKFIRVDEVAKELEISESHAYAELILNGYPETYLKTVTEYKPLDS